MISRPRCNIYATVEEKLEHTLFLCDIAEAQRASQVDPDKVAPASVRKIR